MAPMSAHALVVLASDPKKATLFSVVPWWGKLVVGVVMVIVSACIHFWRKRHDNGPETQQWSVGSTIEMIFGFMGLIAILEAIGLF